MSLCSNEMLMTGYFIGDSKCYSAFFSTITGSHLTVTQ